MTLTCLNLLLRHHQALWVVSRGWLWFLLLTCCWSISKETWPHLLEAELASTGRLGPSDWNPSDLWDHSASAMPCSLCLGFLRHCLQEPGTMTHEDLSINGPARSMPTKSTLTVGPAACFSVLWKCHLDTDTKSLCYTTETKATL